MEDVGTTRALPTVLWSGLRTNGPPPGRSTFVAISGPEQLRKRKRASGAGGKIVTRWIPIADSGTPSRRVAPDQSLR